MSIKIDAAELIDAVLEGMDPDDLVDELVNSGVEEMTMRRQRFSGRKGVNPRTGKRIDPAKSRKMKAIRRKHKSAFAKGAKKTARKMKSSGAFAKMAKFRK